MVKAVITEKIAFIGVGSMGAKMAKRLIAAGLNVQICDTQERTRLAFSKLGAETTAKASDCAGADVVFVMVHTDEALHSVTFDSGGVAAPEKKSKPSVICIMSTALPKTMQALAVKANQMGIALVDAPVSGGPARAEDGSLSIFVGSHKEQFDRLKPILALMGKNLYHCGKVGSASAVKVINNLIGLTNIFITGEAYEIASELGLDLHHLCEILDVSTGSNFISADLNQGIKQFQEWSGNDASFAAIKAILSKDLGFAMTLIKPERAETSLTKTILQYAQSEDEHLLSRWKRLADLPFKI